MRNTKFEAACIEFDEAGSAIMDRFRLSRLEDERRAPGSKPRRCPSPSQTRWGIFKRDSYDLIRRTLRKERGANILKQMILNCRREPVFLTFIDHKFVYGLLAIDQDRFELTKQQIHDLSLQFTYADLHRVEPRYLVGFLYQSGNPKLLPAKLRSGFVEPGFEREAW